MGGTVTAQGGAAPEARRDEGRCVVVSYCPPHAPDGHSHDGVTRMKIAEKLARLKGCDFAGEYRRGESYDGALYFVPSATIVGCEAAAALGIRGADDLFGGVVPYSFAGTKTITHGLIDAPARAPHGWSRGFTEEIRHAVLDGYSAFCRADAMRAGERLLALGAVRVKPALALGGRGQLVVGSLHGLGEALDALDAAEVERYGVALEQNLVDDVHTYSVGQVRVHGLVASYVGTQSIAIDNNGDEVYGGSDLIVARGDFGALLALNLPAVLKRVTRDARTYDAAAHAHFDGFFASRRNYDVVEGRDARGVLRTGVLEQSWRVGGASGAEIAALEWFARDPGTPAVRARCIEVYGECDPPPAGAHVYFRDVDGEVGYITKYTTVEPWSA